MITPFFQRSEDAGEAPPLAKSYHCVKRPCAHHAQAQRPVAHGVRKRSIKKVAVALHVEHLSVATDEPVFPHGRSSLRARVHTPWS